MPKNNAPEIVMEMRRQAVASILARRPRVTQREIWAHLAGEDRGGVPRIINPDTGEPFSLGTINNDIQTLRDEYREKRKKSCDEWVERVLLIYEDLLLQAQREGDLSETRRIIADLRKLMGLDAPEEVRSTGEVILRVKYEDDGNSGTPS